MVRHHLTVLLALLAPVADTGPAVPASVLPDKAMLARLRPGDIVLRVGRGWRAEAVRTVSSFRYTHVGILVERRGDGVWMVGHAAPPEGRDDGGARIEPLTRFAASDEASGVAFERPPALGGAERKRLIAAVKAIAGERHPFDDVFNLTETRALYCTELVWRAFRDAGRSFPARTTHVALGPVHGDYMLPRDLVIAGRFLPVPNSGDDIP